jgi:hypothetical protein
MALIMLPCLPSADNSERQSLINTDFMAHCSPRTVALEAHFKCKTWDQVLQETVASIRDGFNLTVQLDGETLDLRFWVGQKNQNRRSGSVWWMRPLDSETREESPFSEEQLQEMFREQHFSKGCSKYETAVRDWQKSQNWRSALEMVRGTNIYYLRCVLSPAEVRLRAMQK